MRQRKEADSDHDWRWGIKRQKANTWSFFKLRKLISCYLFVGERRHNLGYGRNPESKVMREKKSFSLEWIHTQEFWWTSLNETPKAGDLSTRKEIIINLGLIRNKTCTSLSTCYENPITKGKKRKEKTLQSLK